MRIAQCPALAVVWLAAATLALGQGAPAQVTGSAAQKGAPASLVSQAQVPAAGLENAWDVRRIVSALQKDTAQLQPLLADIKPQSWSDQKGAPTTYIVQWQSAQQQLNDLIAVTKLFAQKTESLTQGLDTYFRLESLEVAERSLAEGAQKYDSRTTTDRLNTMIAHNFNSRERLREYLQDLTANTEANFRVADQEAQRCRGMISREPPATPSRKPKRN